MKLMLVESPHKAKVIGGFLGSGWKVMATIGSMFDIQGAKTAAEKAKYDTYGISTVDWERNLKTSNAKQLGLIRSALTGVTDLYVATDPDRAGEQIGHEVVAALAPVIKKHGIKVWRVTWNEITKQAVQDGLAKRGAFNDNMIDAAVARQVYDRLFGYSVSPAIWKNVSPGLSGGRVQSPALRLIVNREKERLAFVSVTYLSVDGAFTVDTGNKGGRESLTASLIEVDGVKVATGASFNDKGEPRDGVLVLEKKDWAALKKSLSSMVYSVTSVSSKPYRRRPPAPYTTSSFQQAVGNALSMSSSRVMGIAQKLYDAGLVTYTRTDSPAMSAEGTAAARAEALRLHPNSVPAQPNYYKAKSKNAQEGHEAIRPTATNGKFTPPSALSRKLTADELDVYTMVYNRAVASQMTDAVGITTTVRIEGTTNGEGSNTSAAFSTSATSFTDPGWMALADVKDTDNPLNGIINEGNPAALDSLAPKERSTAPPARFTEPQLVAKLEELGIGRPSTYASIVTVNQTRDYVRKANKALYPTWVGFRVAQFLEAEAMNSVDYAFTAAMEEQLDEIEQGIVTKDAFLRSEWDRITREIIPLSKSIATADSEVIDLNNGYQVRVIRNNAMLQVAGAPGGTPESPAEGAWLRDNEDLSMDLSADKCEQLLAEASNRIDSRDFGVLEVGPYAGWTVQGKSGKFGQYLSASPPEEGPKTKRPKPVNNQLPEGKDLSTITVAEVREIYAQTKLPRTLTEKLFVGIGKRGPWIGIKETPRGRAKFISMPEGLDPRTVSAEEIEAAVDNWKQEQAKKPPRKTSAKKAPTRKQSTRATTARAATKKPATRNPTTKKETK